MTAKSVGRAHRRTYVHSAMQCKVFATATTAASVTAKFMAAHFIVVAAADETTGEKSDAPLMKRHHPSKAEATQTHSLLCKRIDAGAKRADGFAFIEQ